MSTLNALKTAIIEQLSTVQDVAFCGDYAGQLESDGARKTIQTPAVLVVIRSMQADKNDPGTGEVDMKLDISALIVTRHARSVEDGDSDALVMLERLLTVVRLNQWGLAKVNPAQLNHARKLNDLARFGAAVWELNWSQKIRIGESVWEQGLQPTEILLGFAPDIGFGHEPDYIPVQSVPASSSGV